MIKISVKKIFISFFLFSACLTPIAASSAANIPINSPLAQNTDGYQPLAPLPGMEDADKTDFVGYANSIIYFIVGFAAVLAVLVLVYGGFLYMTGEALHTKELGKETMQNAIYGLLLLLASYIILFTINPDLVNLNLNVCSPGATDCGGDGNIDPGGGQPGGPNNPRGYNISNGRSDGYCSEIGKCYDNMQACLNASGNSSNCGYFNPGDEVTCRVTNNCTGDTPLGHQDALRILGGGITVDSTSHCSNQNVSTCTALQGMRGNTVLGAQNLQDNCSVSSGASCFITMTGGTEVGHAEGKYSHSAGYKFDISKTSGESSVFKSFLSTLSYTDQSGRVVSGVSVVDPGNLNKNFYTEIGGYNYVIRPELNHWDIAVLPDSKTIIPEVE